MTNILNPYSRLKPRITKPYTLIYLIRHCNPDYQKLKTLGDKYMPLSDVGKRQRSYLDRKLADLNIDKIYSSEIVRALESAQNFAKKENKQIIIDSRLNEIDWNDWYKIKYFRMSEKTRIKRISGYRRMDKHLNKMQAQARRLITDIYSKNKRKKIAIFCHGNLIKAIITGILNTDVIGFLSFEIYESSVTKLVVDRDSYIKINYINNICHLPKRPTEDLFKRAINQ